MRGDGEADEINYCLVHVFHFSQPVWLMTDSEMGFICAFFPDRFWRGQRAFRVIPVRPSVGKCADIRALHIKSGDRGGCCSDDTEEAGFA